MTRFRKPVSARRAHLLSGAAAQRAEQAAAALVLCQEQRAGWQIGGANIWKILGMRTYAAAEGAHSAGDANEIQRLAPGLCAL